MAKSCNVKQGDGYKTVTNVDTVTEATNVYEVDENFPISDELKKQFNERIVKPLRKKYLNEDDVPVPVPEKKFNGIIKANFKKNVDQVTMIFKIRSMLEGNHVVRKSLMQEFQYDAIRVAGLDPAKVLHTTYDNDGLPVKVVRLDKVPLPVLRKFYEKTYTTTNATAEENFSGVLGKLRVSIETPRSMRWRDKTGAIDFMVKAVNFFAERIQQHVTNFIDKAPEFGRDFGMADVYLGVKNIVKYDKERKLNSDSDVEKDNVNKINAYFQKIMNGWMVIEVDDKGKPTGKIQIHKNYKPVSKPEEGQDDHEMALRDDTYYSEDGMLRYESTKDLVYAYQDLVTLEEYISGKGLKGDQLKDFKAGNKHSREVELRLEAKEKYLKLNKEQVSDLYAELYVKDNEITDLRSVRGALKDEIHRLDKKLNGKKTYN